MENTEILNEEENILTLTDENGNETAFEYLDVIEYKGEEYLILMPAEEESDETEDGTFDLSAAIPRTVEDIEAAMRK